MAFDRLSKLNFSTMIKPKGGRIKLTAAGIIPVQEIIKVYDNIMLELTLKTVDEKQNLERYNRYLEGHVLQVLTEGLRHEGYYIYNNEQTLGIMLRQYCDTMVRSRFGGNVMHFTDMSCLQDELLLRKFISNCISFGERNFKLHFKSIEEFENHK